MAWRCSWGVLLHSPDHLADGMALLLRGAAPLRPRLCQQHVGAEEGHLHEGMYAAMRLRYAWGGWGRYNVTCVGEKGHGRGQMMEAFFSHISAYRNQHSPLSGMQGRRRGGPCEGKGERALCLVEPGFTHL